MSPERRVFFVVAAVAAAAAALVVGVVAIQSDGHEGDVDEPRAPAPRAGSPPLSLDLGLRNDPEARALRQALRLYDEGKRVRARTMFARYPALEAKVGKAFASWPNGTVERMGQLAALHPRSALVQLNLGIALYWADRPGAEQAWREAADVEPDTPYAVTAGNLLYPTFVRNLPVFVPEESLPRTIAALSGRPAAQLRALRNAARAGRTVDKLFYGVALQRLGRPLAARRVYAEAAMSAPGNPEAQVADAVGHFEKAQPAEAFSRLGPLARRFPHAATVRFHLGLLLLWSGELKEAKRQLRLARASEPPSPLARQAARYLQELASARS